MDREYLEILDALLKESGKPFVRVELDALRARLNPQSIELLKARLQWLAHRGFVKSYSLGVYGLSPQGFLALTSQADLLPVPGDGHFSELQPILQGIEALQNSIAGSRRIDLTEILGLLEEVRQDLASARTPKWKRVIEGFNQILLSAAGTEFHEQTSQLVELLVAFSSRR